MPASDSRERITIGADSASADGKFRPDSKRLNPQQPAQLEIAWRDRLSSIAAFEKLPHQPGRPMQSQERGRSLHAQRN